MKKITISLPSLAEQKKIIKENPQNNVANDFSDCDQIPDSWKPFDNGYIAPSASEIRKTFGEFSSSEIANMLGLSDGRIIRRWKSGENQIPYAAWRLFLIITERIII